MEDNLNLDINGVFVAVEGLDGSGTTTQVARLASQLEAQGHDVIATREPTNGIWGSVVRKILAGEADVHPLSLSFGFMADRVDHLQDLHRLSSTYPSPIVITDRYILSYLAYQQQDTGKDLGWLLTTQDGLPVPDITFFLDVPPSICIERLRTSRSTAERFEHLQVLERTRDSYLGAIKKLRSMGQKFEILDGTQPEDELSKQMVDTVLKKDE